MSAHTYSKAEGLLFDGLLQFNVVLVGNIQGHLQLSDMNLQLLLDACDLSL